MFGLRVIATALLCAVALSQECTYISNNDYDQGSGGPNQPANGPADCCAQCIAAGNATCYAAVYDDATGGICWFKTMVQTQKPIWSPSLTACWPPGSVPPPPPPPPPPPKYGVTVISRSTDPVVSYLGPASNSRWPQSFNPAFVQPSAGTGYKRGLLVRSQNCTGWSPGQCIFCNVNGNHPIAPWFPGSVITFAQQRDDGSFAEPYLVFAPRSDNDDEIYGTEDPRLAYDNKTGLYHVSSDMRGPPQCAHLRGNTLTARLSCMTPRNGRYATFRTMLELGPSDPFTCLRHPVRAARPTRCS